MKKRTTDFFGQFGWMLITCVIVSGTASCGESPSTNNAAPVQNDPKATAVTNLPLKEIMQGLEGDLAALGRGIWAEDLFAVRRAARAIADHPKVTQAQVATIQTALGVQFSNFVGYDKGVHRTAAMLAESTDSTMAISEAFDAYLQIQRGCLSCHSAFRTRVSEALELQNSQYRVTLKDSVGRVSG